MHWLSNLDGPAAMPSWWNCQNTARSGRRNTHHCRSPGGAGASGGGAIDAERGPPVWLPMPHEWSRTPVQPSTSTRSPATSNQPWTVEHWS